MAKERRAAKKKREDQALNRVLWWFGGAVLLEFLLLLLNRYYVHYDTSGIDLAHGLAQFLQVLVWAALVAAVGCGVWLLVWKKQGKKLFPPAVCLTISAAVLICSFVSRMWDEVGVQCLYISVPVVAVLGLIYYLYQREFFFIALQGGVTLFAMWIYRRLVEKQAVAVYIIFAVVFLAVAAVAALSAVLQVKGGALGKRQVLDKSASYPMIYVGSAVSLCALAVALLLGATAAYVALFVVAAWLFAAAIYYTVRLM